MRLGLRGENVIGKVLGRRYRLIELIGEGGMALVYKAECSLLCRVVAVKILRPQYANDVDFVERFRREARAAASLSHPNVVGIFDVGQEDGINYIVMEYLPGDNLKSIIKKNAPLPISRALEITKQIAEALNHAHQRNIIHRDIKPHNILVTPEGQIKVTDFGIARAISVSSFTQTGEVLGSVQYCSPEQAKGEPVGPQSDIYSLGCVLYELLTGRVPFAGESSIAIAMQHLQGEYTSIKEIRTDIPDKLVKIVAKAMDKDLAERYPSALAMTKEITFLQNNQSKVSSRDSFQEVDLPTQVWTEPLVVEPQKEVEQGGKRRKRSVGFWIATVAGLLTIVSISMLLLMMNVVNPLPPQVSVPDLKGKDINYAKGLLLKQKLELKVVNRLYNANFPNDTIISQYPIPGRKKRAGTEVEVVVSKGPQLVKVPLLIGKSQREVELILEETGLLLGEVLTDYNPNYEKEVVIKQLPEQTTQIEKGASVSITLNSEVNNEIEVPNFIGKPLSEVQAELNNLGLVYNQAKPTTSDIYPKGVVTDQTPVPYSKVAKGTAMNFMVSKGPLNESNNDF